MHDKNGLLEMERAAKSPLGPQSHNGEPQSEPPRLADLLDQVAHVIEIYIKLPIKALSLLIACWIVLTYTYTNFRYCGYLALRSATPRCGKTRLLRLISLLALDAPSITTNPTAPVLFRSQRKVLVLDEVDRLRNADKENFGVVLSILNVGFEQGAIVERMEKTKGGNFEVKAFPVYRPVALAGIESLADTLSDRTFAIQMERTAERMPRFSARILDELAGQLRAGFQSWADQYAEYVEAAYDSLPDEVDTLKDFDDRFQDIAEPLIVLAALADSERPDGPAILPRLMNGLQAAAGRREPSGRERELLAFLDMVDPLLNGEDEVFLPSSTILDLCKDREELSGLETGRALAGFLKHFDVFPKSHSGKTRGYAIRREWLSIWGARYGRQ
jgi:hypothetical protein